MSTRKTNWYFFLVKLIPKRLRYFVTVSSIAHCTTGKYCNTVVPDLKAVDVLGILTKDWSIP